MTLKKLFLLCFILTSVFGNAQSKKIRILKADNTFTDTNHPDATISVGNVIIAHEGATLHCDKAYIYHTSKQIKAVGNVVINQGDTIFQYSKYTNYNANTKKATSWGNVVLKDPLMTLKTDTLHFNRTTQHLYYNTGGTLKDSTNFLKSKEGNYYLNTRKFQAFNKVQVTNKNSNLLTNHLNYSTHTGIAKVFEASTITSKQNTIYTEKGVTNTKTNISHFLKNSKFYFEDRIIKGDSLYYNKNTEFASATGNVKIIDTLNQLLVKGGYAEYYKLKDSAFVTKKAVAINTVENDSLYIHGDILLLTGKAESRILKAFKHVKFFKSDLQGKCDSLISNEKTGLTQLFKNPILWAQDNQITGDSIQLISNSKTEQLDSLKILGNAFMIQKDSAGYSQLKGKNMYGKFKENKLKTLNVIGNSETLFYGRDEKGILVAISKMKSSKNIFITFKNRKISTIDFIKKPDGKTYPPSELHNNDRLLNGFIWRGKEQPLTKEAIFIHDKTPPKEIENLLR